MPITSRIQPNTHGFSLIEVMVAMFIASAGVLSMSTLTISSLSANALARERVAATNLAVDVIESWQASSSDTLPSLICTQGTVQLATGSPTGTQSSCTLDSQEVQTSFKITINAYRMQAPLPPNPAGIPVMTDLYAGLRISSLLVDRNNASTIYAGTNGDGLYTSSDSGATWSRIYGTESAKINALIQMPGTSTIIVAGSDNYTLANTNWGGTWQRLATGLGNNNILSLATDAYSTLYAGADNYAVTSNGGAYKSTNTANTWSASNGTPTSLTNLIVNAVAVDSYVYAGTNVGLFRSIDDGYTWTNPVAPANVPIYSLSLDPTHTNRVYAGTATEVLLSSDKGNSWASTLAATLVVRALATDSNGGMYAGTDSGTYATFSGSLTHSTTGLPFQNTVRTYSLGVPSTAAPTVLYAGTDGGVFKSSNSGTSWTRSDTGIGILPKEKVVKVSWSRKGETHQVILTHITQRPY
ncbi:MAG: prepilin-type N-terminal cleavage/methylation domain-containing protein [Mariprofundales bacterium]|nr:prepilin-type N-terminal cleavage/methylation domain-containing protein [Mariprofundales bacterium]